MKIIIKLFYLLIIGFPIISQAEQLLTPIQYFKITGARELTPFTLNGEHYIAAAQLARDIPNTPPSMEGGDADVDVVIFKQRGNKFIEYQRIPSHGNEGATFFIMGKSSFLAVASIHSGPKPPFNMHTYSMLYRWDGQYFYPVQQFLNFGAKQLYHFNIGKRLFLAMANGVSNDKPSTQDTNSFIYEWNGQQFVLLQTIPSLWGVSFKSYTINGVSYLAFADHLKGGAIYRWNGKEFKLAQEFPGIGSKAFEYFTIGDKYYLAHANLKSDSMIYQWNGNKFAEFQVLKGPGGRSFTYFSLDGEHYLLRVNYILGDRDNPITALQSPLYKWKDGTFVPIQNIPTFGGVVAHVFKMDDLLYLTLANCLNSKGGFRVDSVLYEITHGVNVEFS